MKTEMLFRFVPNPRHLQVMIEARRDGRVVDVGPVNLDCPKSRQEYIRRVAPLVECSDTELSEILLAKYDDAKQAAAVQTEVKRPWIREDALTTVDGQVRQEAEALLAHAKLLDQLCAMFAELGIVGEREVVQILYLVATSRILAKPLCAHVSGASGCAKSFIVRTIAGTMPEPEVLHAHDITPQSLYYCKPGSLRHRLVVGGERVRQYGRPDWGEVGSKAFRELSEDGRLAKLVTVGNADGPPVAERIEIEGPIAFIETSTADRLHEEDRLRMLVLHVTETQALNCEILRAKQAELAGHAPDLLRQAHIRDVLRAAQLLLDRDFEVCIPYAGLLNLPVGHVAVRRAIVQLGSLIRSCTLLRQKQKPVETRDGQRRIAADVEDYRIVYPLAKRAFASLFDPLDGKARELLLTIEANFAGRGFTRDQLAAKLGICEGHGSRRLRGLITRGLVHQDRTVRPHILRRSDARIDDCTDLGLPDPAIVAEFERKRQKGSCK